MADGWERGCEVRSEPELPAYLREERAWREIRGEKPAPAVPLTQKAGRAYVLAEVRRNLRSSSSWGSGNRFARRFAQMWRPVPQRPQLSAILPEFASHWRARPERQKERAAWFFRRACKFEDWARGVRDALPYYVAR